MLADAFLCWWKSQNPMILSLTPNGCPLLCWAFSVTCDAIYISTPGKIIFWWLNHAQARKNFRKTQRWGGRIRTGQIFQAPPHHQYRWPLWCLRHVRANKGLLTWLPCVNKNASTCTASAEVAVRWCNWHTSFKIIIKVIRHPIYLLLEE
jgi:hypothetical protein